VIVPDIYWNQIKTILAPGLGCMAGVAVATDEGVFPADLADYQTVKRLHRVIAAALNGWARDANGQWKNPLVRTKDHSMPPGGPLPVEHVDTFLAWVKDGMPEGPAMV
jgi:hypothetical protein